MQSYKIYINGKPLILTNTEHINAYTNSSNKVLVVRYSGKPKYLLNVIDSLEKGNKYGMVVIHARNYKGLKTDMKSLFNVIKAGGGIVENEMGEMLFIYRKGYWDLPKGKCDPGEKRKQAAFREVMEETGVRDLSQHQLLSKTRHVYREKGVRSLKITKWYAMTAPRQELVPEAKEQIELAMWIEPHRFLTHYKPSYESIRDLIRVFVDSTRGPAMRESKEI